MNGTVWDTNVEWKPIGRGRHFDRLRRGLARRLRIPYVRKVLWERDNPQTWTGQRPPTYGPMFLSTNALANCSFACTCHKGERYDRRKGR